jgi:hypothetical protein
VLWTSNLTPIFPFVCKRWRVWPLYRNVQKFGASIRGSPERKARNELLSQGKSWVSFHSTLRGILDSVTSFGLIFSLAAVDWAVDANPGSKSHWRFNLVCDVWGTMELHPWTRCRVGLTHFVYSIGACFVCQTLENIVEASMIQLSGCPGIGQKKVRAYFHFEPNSFLPFRITSYFSTNCSISAPGDANFWSLSSTIPNGELGSRLLGVQL